MESKKNDNKKEKKKEDERAIVCPVSLRNVDGLFFCCCCCCCCIDGNRWKSWCYRVFFLFKKKRFSFHTAEPVRSSWADAITGLYRVYIYIFLTPIETQNSKSQLHYKQKQMGPTGIPLKSWPWMTSMTTLRATTRKIEWWIHWVYLVLLGLKKILRNHDGFQRVFIRCDWIFNGLMRFHWVLPSFTGF